MTILLSIIGVIARFAAALLTTALGWASSLLFGRVQRSHQIFVVLMLAGSLTWLCLVVCAIAPVITDTLFDVTPHPSFLDKTAVRVAILVGLVVVPLGVGLAAWLVPTDGERPAGPRVVLELLRGYLLTPMLGGLMLFLPAVGISRKARSVRHGWSDTHIPIVVKPKGYDRTVAALQAALAEADLEVEADEAPAVLSLPAWLLTRVSGSGIGALRADRLMELKGPRLRVGVYPSDIAISGPSPERGMARVAIIRRLPTPSTYLTTSAEAQAVEDRLVRLADRLSTMDGLTPTDVATEFAGIDETLRTLELPVDEWDLLYRIRLKTERDVLAGDAHAGTGDGATAAAKAAEEPAARRPAGVEPARGAAR